MAVLIHYSPEHALNSFMYQKEQCCWSIAAGNPPIGLQPGEITLQCPPSNALSEFEPFTIVVKTSVLPPGITIDKKSQLWVKFQKLVEEWKMERGTRSSITQAAALQSYQKIIGMGPDVIPLLISQLKSEGDKPDQWFWALRAITAQNPVKAEDRGNFPKMAQAWIEWAEATNNAW